MNINDKAIPVKERHAAMVANLAKPGADIKATVTQFELHVLKSVASLQLRACSELVSMLDIVAEDEESSWYHEIHMLVGTSGELGELLDCIKKAIIYRKPLDVANAIEELGDYAFYMQGLGCPIEEGYEDIDAILDYVNSEVAPIPKAGEEPPITLETCLEANIVKLGKRYSSGSYSDKQAQVRADKTEEVKH